MKGCHLLMSPQSYEIHYENSWVQLNILFLKLNIVSDDFFIVLSRESSVTS